MEGEIEMILGEDLFFLLNEESKDISVILVIFN